MRLSIIAFYTISLSTLLFSCSEKSEDETDTGESVDSQDTDDTGPVVPPEDPCLQNEVGDGYRIEGRVEYSDGTTAKGNVRVQMCSGSCFIGSWGDDGGMRNFSFCNF